MLTDKQAAARRARQERTLVHLLDRAALAPRLTAEMLVDLAAPTLRLSTNSMHERAVCKQKHWRHQAAKRHAGKLQRTPPWADLEAIRALHAQAQKLTLDTGIKHHVDHVLPLQGRRVSGLHVHTNMQILTGSDNSRKWNRFEP